MRDCLAVMSVLFCIYQLFDSLLHCADCKIVNNEKKLLYNYECHWKRKLKIYIVEIAWPLIGHY